MSPETFDTELVSERFDHRVHTLAHPHRERAGIHLSAVRLAEGFASGLKGSTSSDKLESIRFLGETDAPADSR